MLTAREAVATEVAAFTPPPGDARRNRVPFGIYHLDLAFVRGVKPLSPQIIAIQGGSGSRKTTTMINIIINQILSGKLPQGMTIGMDMLESGMTIERLILIMECIVATKIMVYEFHTGPQGRESLWHLFNRRLPSSVQPQDLLSPIGTGARTDIRLNPDFLEACYAGQKGFTLSERQRDAWGRAAAAVHEFPVIAFGVSEHYQDDIRAERYTNSTLLSDSLERWLSYTKEHGMRQLVVDYIQEYAIPEVYDHYKKQLRAVPVISEWAKETGSTAWVLSQEGITHQRDARSYDGEVLGSSGGDILKSQSQLNLRVEYRPKQNPCWTLLFSPVKARRGNFGTVGIPTEPFSGAFFGQSVPYKDIKGQLGR